MRRLLLASLLLPTLAHAAPPRARTAGAPATPAAGPPAALPAALPGTPPGEEARLAQQRVNAATRLHATETEVAERATAVTALAERRDAAAAALAAHARAMAPLLPLVERLALYPAETLLAVPAPPDQAIRGIVVLRGIARQLEVEAEALRRQQAQLDADAAALAAALPPLQAAQAEQEAQSRALDAQIEAARAARSATEAAADAAARRAAAEAARADSLRAAMATLEAARARAETEAREEAVRAERTRQDAAAGDARRREAAAARQPAPEPGRGIVLPVAGTVTRGWGATTDAGPATGISFRPAPGARVVAPCAGRVRFAGPFRSYGALVILDCGGGYAFVLAGLGRLDVPAGSTVLAGEPVGLMPSWDATVPGPRPALYVELRRDGQAIDPGPFLHGRG